jgi:hypothetical protein
VRREEEPVAPHTTARRQSINTSIGKRQAAISADLSLSSRRQKTRRHKARALHVQHDGHDGEQLPGGRELDPLVQLLPHGQLSILVLVRAREGRAFAPVEGHPRALREMPRTHACCEHNSIIVGRVADQVRTRACARFVIVHAVDALMPGTNVRKILLSCVFVQARESGQLEGD